MTKPIVAIVGRPNVGKSTLFNRLAGQRLAIVEDIPGTTRDRVYTDITWGEKPLTIVDTGGLEPEPESELRQMVQEQVKLAIEEADVIIFVVDAQSGVTVPDTEVSEDLRRSKKPVVLAVNKTENEKLRDLAFQFHELGIGDPMPISAIHGDGILDLIDAVSAILPPVPPPSEETAMLKVAIVGRPNVGKSALLNALIGQERVIVDDVPGTTRDAIDTVFESEGEPVLLIDTAGIRRRGRVERGIETYSVMRSLRAISRADVALLVTDVPDLITAQDMHVGGYIQQGVKGLVVVVNKWDLAPEFQMNQETCTHYVRDRIKFFTDFPILFVSALTGAGVEKIIPAARQVWQERQRRIPTPELNDFLERAVAAHPPPSVKGRRPKISYVTQAGINPPIFVFFVNNPSMLHFSYRRYLENQLRKAFGFSGTPTKLVFRRKGEK